VHSPWRISIFIILNTQRTSLRQKLQKKGRKICCFLISHLASFKRNNNKHESNYVLAKSDYSACANRHGTTKCVPISQRVSSFKRNTIVHRNLHGWLDTLGFSTADLFCTILGVLSSSFKHCLKTSRSVIFSGVKIMKKVKIALSLKKMNCTKKICRYEFDSIKKSIKIILVAKSLGKKK
jgi:hypothetical protein